MRDTLTTEVLRRVKAVSDWNVLVVDRFATRVISACARLSDLHDEGVVLVEDVLKSRQPFRKCDAIYLVQPTTENVDAILCDFTGSPTYRAAHVFFVDACPDALFQRLAAKALRPFIKTAMELDMNVVPAESRVFSLDDPDGFHSAHSGERNRAGHSAAVAAHLASLCTVLGVRPRVRYSGTSDVAKAIAVHTSDRMLYLDSVADGGTPPGARERLPARGARSLL